MDNMNILSQSEKEQVLDLLSGIVAIPSVKDTPLPDAPFGAATRDALTYMLSAGDNFGFVTKNLDNRVGYIEWGESGPLIAVLCHLDVVPAGEGWSNDPFKLRRENNCLIGRGVIDDKGPAVCTLYAMKRLKDRISEPKCRFRLILGLDEESGSLCMKRYKETEEMPVCGFTPDASFPPIFAEKGILSVRLFAESSGSLFISGGERSNMVPAVCRVTDPITGDVVETIGAPAHASTPLSGINAISKSIENLTDMQIDASPLLTFYRRFIGTSTDGNRIFVSSKPDLSGALTLNAGIININNQVEELILDIRYPVTQDGIVLYKELEKLANENNLHAEIRSHAEPLHKDPMDPLILSLIHVYDRYATHAKNISGKESTYCFEHPTTPIAIGGGTYARSLPGFVAFGPAFPWDDDQAHSVDESIHEDIFYLLVQIYEDSLLELSANLL